MSIRSIPGRRNIAVIAGILFFVIPAPLIWAQCSYTELEPYRIATTSSVLEFFRIDQTGGAWMAVALQPASGENWDLFMNGSTAPFPDCVGSPLIGSTEGPGVVDFIVGDFTHNLPGLYYPMVKQASGSGNAEIIHDKRNRTLEVNGTVAVLDRGSRISLDCWSVYLEAGHTYSIHLENHPLSGLDPKVFLFRNPGSGPYWASRAAADLEITGPTTYVAPATDWYCLVGVSDNYGAGTYSLSIGECAAPIALTSGVGVPVDLRSTYLEFNQLAQSWAAVGFRYSDAGIGLWIYGDTNTGVYPHCFGDSLFHDDPPEAEVALVAGNFNSGGLPLGTYHGRAEHQTYSASGTIEWESATGPMPINGTPVARQTGPDDVLGCWEIQLDETQSYAFHFAPIGDVDLRLLLYPDPGSPTWTRNAAAGFHTSGQYNPLSTGTYGLVALNRDGEPGEYTLSVNQCLPLPTKFTEHVRVATASAPVSRYSFIQNSGGWAAVAVKGVDDWDMFVFEHASGGDPGFCFSNPLAASSSAPAGGVDFVIGDFHRNPVGEYYASAELASGTGDGTAVWEPYSHRLYVNGMPHNTSLGGNDFINLYEVFLAAGITYQFDLNHLYGSGEPKLSLFAPEGDTYWADRGFREFETSASVLYTPISSGNFGMAVVNDGVDAAGYSVAVTSASVSVEGVPVPQRANIKSVIPNPTSGVLSIQFDLETAARVGFEVFDVAGRMVVRLPARERAPGSWTENWNGMTQEGARAGVGVYFVRMRVAGQPVGVERFVIIE